MNSNPASDLLTMRLRANMQRRKREEWLAELGPALADSLSRAPFITTPDCYIFTRYFAVSPQGAGPVDDKIRPVGFRFFDTGRKEKVVDELARLARSAGRGAAILALNSDLPCFRVDWAEVSPHLAQLLSATVEERLLLITENLASGLVVDTYCGYHPDDDSGDETTYVVATWGKTAGNEK